MDKNIATPIYENFFDEAYYLREKAKRLEAIAQYIFENYEFLTEDSFWYLVKEVQDSTTVFEVNANDIIKEAEARYD